MSPAWLYPIAVVLGLLTGVSDLLMRYRTGARRVLEQGWVYLLLNGAISALALFVVRNVLPETLLSATNQDQRYILQVLLAGTSALVLLKTSLRVTAGNQEIEVGLGRVLQPILDRSNQAIDQEIAMRRLSEVGETVQGLDFEASHQFLAAACLGAMQQVDPEEQEALSQEIEALRQSGMRPPEKTLLLGLLLERTTGREVLKAAAHRYRELNPHPTEAPPH